MKKYLIQKKWYRDLFSRTCFIKVDGVWKNRKDFKKGEKVENVYNGVGTKAWCHCGNELVHSDSFITNRQVLKTGMEVWDYECSHCKDVQFRNPCLMPGIHPCDENGNLL